MTKGDGRRTAIVVLLAALFLFHTACRNRPSPDTLVIAIEATPRGFDPRLNTGNTYSARLMQLIYDTLVARDARFEFIPSLADSFTESEDHRTFTFHIRSGVKFHNGEPLTSKDVKYTFDSLLSPDMKSPIRGAVDKIASIETPDPQTVIFRCREPFYTFIGNLPAIGIIPAGAGTELISAPVGSGPYKLTEYREGERVRLEANRDYWNGPPSIPRVEVKVVSDNTTRQAELMSGAVDLAYNVGFDPETIRALSARRDIQVVIKEGANVDYLGLNLTPGGRLSDQKLRQAVAMAIDRDVIIHNLLRDQARRAEAMMPPEHWAYSSDITVYDHDPERAKRLLDDAGLIDPDGDGPQTRLELSLFTTTTQLSRNIASILQDQLRRIGIQLNLQSLELATLLDRINKGQFDLYYLRAIGFNQSTDVFQFVYHSRYQNAQFNDAIARLRPLTDQTQMKPLFDTVASILASREYCANEEVDKLAAQAEETDSPTARKELYLQIARLLTDRGGQNRMRYCNPQVDRLIVEAERAPRQEEGYEFYDVRGGDTLWAIARIVARGKLTYQQIFEENQDILTSPERIHSGQRLRIPGSKNLSPKVELYRRIQKTISEELPQIYLWYPSNAMVAGSRVGHVEIDPSGSWYFIARLTIDSTRGRGDTETRRGSGN